MKIQLSLKQLFSLFALITVGVLGAYVGFLTYQYKVVTRGILSFLVLYLIFQVAWFLRGEKIDALFKFPKNIKYYIFGFFWTLVVMWVLGFIVEMILFLIN